MKSSGWIKVAAIATGAYLVYRMWSGAKALTAPVANVIGDTIAKVALPGQVSVKGSLILPDGTSFPWNTLTRRSDFNTYFSGNLMYVSFGGKTYRVKGRDANGNYLAA